MMSKIREIKTKEILGDPINLELISLVQELNSQIAGNLEKAKEEWEKKSFLARMFSEPKAKDYVGFGDVWRKSCLSYGEFKKRMFDLESIGVIGIAEVIEFNGPFDNVVDNAVVLLNAEKN